MPRFSLYFNPFISRINLMKMHIVLKCGDQKHMQQTSCVSPVLDVIDDYVISS